MTATRPPARRLPRRVSPGATVRQTFTLAWRSLVQIKHNPWELLDLSIQPIMFLLLFTYVFGGAISGSTGDYLQFALPGLLVQNALFYTLSTAIGLNTDITKGVFDRLSSLPIARSAPLAGADHRRHVQAGLGVRAADRVRHGARASGSTTGVAGVLGALALLVVVALAMSWLSVLIGLTASSPEKVQMFAFSTMLPLTFTSSALVNPDTFPGWLRAWARVNPVTHLSDAIRGLLIGGEVAQPALVSLLWAAGFMVVFAPLAIRVFRRTRLNGSFTPRSASPATSSRLHPPAASEVTVELPFPERGPGLGGEPYVVVVDDRRATPLIVSAPPSSTAVSCGPPARQRQAAQAIDGDRRRAARRAPRSPA